MKTFIESVDVSNPNICYVKNDLGGYVTIFLIINEVNA